jgi:hypothetical protein
MALTSPERDEVYGIEHHPEDASHVRRCSRHIDAQDDEECESASADEHRDLWSCQVRTTKEPASEYDSQHRGSSWRDVQKLIAWQSSKAKTGGDRWELPLQAITTLIHEHLHQAE